MMMWPFPDDGSFDSPSRGPRGADNPDTRLTHLVADRLLTDPLTRRQPITVEVQNQVVLLTGTVDCAETKRAAGDAARRTSGVHDVQNGLRVHPVQPPMSPTVPSRTGPARNDTDDGQQFDEIVAGLTTDDRTSVGRTGALRQRTTVTLLVLFAALTWAVLSILMVRHGWIGVLVACAVGAMALAIRYLRRPGRRYPDTPANRQA